MTEEQQPTGVDGPKQKQRVLKKIPQKVIQNAVGLAIFTTMRSGLWVSGAGGSGVLVARQEDGSWSPPSGIMLHTAGLGFLVGIDIYDCVLVINNRKALDSFTKVRATIGGEISAVAGPVGVGGVLENDGKWKQMNRPVFTYLKSRGFYAGVQVDGTIVIERTDENERFYNQKIGVTDILAGKVRHVPRDTKLLAETLKMAEGREDIDQDLMEELEGQPAPGDVEVEATIPMFGIPEPDDPDPFGVLALEEAGLEIKEAGTNVRPASTHFEFRPSPTSPIFTHVNRRSVDTNYTSNRGSYMSNLKRTSLMSTVQTVSMGTQTDMDDFPNSPVTTPSIKNESTFIKEEKIVEEPKEVDYTQIDLGPYSSLAYRNNSDEFNGSGTTVIGHEPWQNQDHGNHAESEVDTAYGSEDDLDDEEPVVFETAAATAQRGSFLGPSQVNVVKAKGSVVTIPKRVPPPLPPRNSARGSRAFSNDAAENGMSPLASPREDGFEDVDLSGFRRPLSPKTNGVETEDNTKNIKEEDSEVDVSAGEYLNFGSQTTSEPSPEAETSTQSQNWNAASLPNLKGSSEVVEFMPTTSSSSASDSTSLENQTSASSTISIATETAAEAESEASTSKLAAQSSDEPHEDKGDKSEGSQSEDFHDAVSTLPEAKEVDGKKI